MLGRVPSPLVDGSGADNWHPACGCFSQRLAAYFSCVLRDAFPGYDDPDNFEGEPDNGLKFLLCDEISQGGDVVEPVSWTTD